jgi:hypothetical protein
MELFRRVAHEHKMGVLSRSGRTSERKGESEMKKMMLLASMWVLLIGVAGCQSCRLCPGRNDAASPRANTAPVSVPVLRAP